jgi:hypothetical protein
MKETQRRRITVTSSLYEKYVGNEIGWGKGRRRYSPTPFYSRLLDKYLKTT